MSRNSSEIISRAVVIAIDVSGGASRVIHVRHLFAALITPRVAGSRSVRERLKGMEVDES
jgi:hypothetical protein